MGEDHYKEFVGAKSIAISIILTIVFWVAFTRMLLPFVPADRAIIQYAVSAYTSLCLAGVFYVAVHMFMLVLAEHKKAQRAKA